MMKAFLTGLLLLMAIPGWALEPDPEAFSLLDLNRPGMENVLQAWSARDVKAAADALLDYYRSRKGISVPGFSPSALPSETERKWADDALEHRFFVHAGYQPSYFYGDDIDWTYWPVKDNELRWQLHRTKWWVPLGKVWRQTKDDRYAAEWVSEYLDWMRKNPLGDYDEGRTGDLLTADNMYFAWRPLEVSDRLEHQAEQFLLMLPSKPFDGAFLTHFIVNYHRHGDFLSQHFAAKGNHRLFEAQRLLLASVFLPELRDAPSWQRYSIDILGEEIARQVYPDGIQIELDPHYHLECIRIFAKALAICEEGALKDMFPADYTDTVRRMVEAVYNYSFPDLTNPMFSDFHGQHDMLPLYRQWLSLFPDDGMISWLASGGKEGSVPHYLSRAFPNGGFYCLRNGWTDDATVMVVKAGPPAFWHCQPDNGTFEYWRRGRNFFPDSGGYVYGGDSRIQAQRAWFRQTSVHNTLTLGGRNLENTDSRLLSWSADSTGTILAVENPSYKGLTHRRNVHFRNDGSVLIEDTASGEAEGEVAVHYNLLPCDPEEDFQHRSIKTAFPDGNNIRLTVLSPSYLTVSRQEGRVSYAYKQYQERPSYAFSAFKKAGEAVIFITLIEPCK